MNRLALSLIAHLAGGHLHGEDTTVDAVSNDTRALRSGSLYVALRGERFDGHDFVAAAAQAGAAALLVEHAVQSELPQVIVADAQLALARLAAGLQRDRSGKVVAITGSNGKTSVKMLVSAILQRAGQTYSSPGNRNNEIGLPLAVIEAPDQAEFAVYEMGAGKPGDIAYLAAIARPDIGLVTLIAPAHLARMGSIEGVAETKGALYQALPADGIAIINADDAFASFFGGLAGARRQLRFGLDQPADVGADIIEQRVDGSRFVLSTPHGDAEVALPLPGRHNIANALAATAVALALEVPLETIVAGLGQVPGVAGRLRREVMDGGWTLIDDSYNANPSSMAAAIDTLLLAGGERWLVLGDMRELGPEAATLHAAAGARARQAGIARLYALGPLSAHAAHAFGEGARVFDSHAALAQALQHDLQQIADPDPGPGTREKQAQTLSVAPAQAAVPGPGSRVPGPVLLIKGSRGSAMDRIVSALLPAAPTHSSGGTAHAA